ncbi:MAG: peptidase dipeptidase dipeptidase [Candidatus Saccharibacteria bacterium]|nr:peptidase dipeptidase dipeptidase [Candidatus Saccharibacteria bacterium]
MKLLLTSNGLSNDSIAAAFEDLIGKAPSEAKIAFIPTAGFIDRDNKEWLIQDMYRIFDRGYQVDIIDLTALTSEQIKDALTNSDAIFVGGGNTFYLSYWMEKMGLFELLPKLLETKVYAGISAGSMVAGQSLALSSPALNNPQAFIDEHYDEVGPSGQSLNKTLNLVDFIFRPHLNSRHFYLVKIDELKEKAKGLNKAVYAIDDNSALKIIDGNVEVISEGEWTLLDPIA